MLFHPAFNLVQQIENVLYVSYSVFLCVNVNMLSFVYLNKFIFSHLYTYTVYAYLLYSSVIDFAVFCSVHVKLK